MQLTGSGNLSLGADLTFAEVTKSNGDNCRARVQGVATFSYAGLPPGKSKLDYLMTVKGGQATFLKYASAGEAPKPSEGQFDLRMLGLFAYDGKLNAGQKLPGSSFRLKIGKEAPVGGQPSTTVRIGEKTVGQKTAVNTALGPAVLSSDLVYAQLGSHDGHLPGPDHSDPRHEHHRDRLVLPRGESGDEAGHRSGRCEIRS